LLNKIPKNQYNKQHIVYRQEVKIARDRTELLQKAIYILYAQDRSRSRSHPFPKSPVRLHFFRNSPSCGYLPCCP
ncbi:hypothetical protein QUB33_18615, partial [Microcoleus sp. B3-A4]